MEDDECVVHPLTINIKSQLLECLSRVDCAGSFATFAPYPNATNPGIVIDGIGSIGLPLSVRDAKAIVKTSHLAPFGLGGRTVLDSKVRHTWELNADQFKLENPTWPQTVQEIIDRVKTELGVQSGIEAIPYKMLLYEKGAMFKQHTDSEKVPGMFGTLVISLPSEHDGGHVHLTHGTEEKLFNTAKTSRFDFAYLAWYSDVIHEVQPVTKGYRFVLTYNLLHRDPGTRQSATDLCNEKEKLQEIIASWKSSYDARQDGCPKALAYLLDHKYTDANLQLGHLKRNDQLILQYLQDVCGRNDFSVFLANLELSLSGDCYDQAEYEWSELYFEALRGNADTLHDIEVVNEKCLIFTVVADLDGTIILRNIGLDESILVQSDAFEGDPDEEDWSGPTGNEGISATHFYRKTVAILVPNEYHVKFFFKACKSDSYGETAMRTWINYLVQKSEGPANEGIREELVRLCQMIVKDTKKQRTDMKRWLWDVQHSSIFNDDLLGTVVEVSLYLGDLNLLSDAVSTVIKKLPQRACLGIGQAIHYFGFPEMHKILDQAVLNLGFHEMQETLEGILAGYKSKDSKPKDLVTIENWERKKTEGSLNIDEVGRKDGDALVKVISKYQNTPWLFQKVLSFVELHASNVRFAIALATGQLDAIQRGIIAPTKAADASLKILSGLIPAFVLEDTARANKRPKTSQLSRNQALVNEQDIATLLRLCITLNLTDHADQILAKLVDYAENDDPFPNCLLTVLKHLCSIMDENDAIHPTPPPANVILEKYRQFSQSILEACAKRIGAKPTQDKDWARILHGCGCNDCNLLDKFLLDPEREAEAFVLADKGCCNHLNDQLPYEWLKEYVTETICENDGEKKLMIRKNAIKLPFLLNEWKLQRSNARRLVRAIGKEEQLRSLVGERYDELVGGLLAGDE